MAVLPANLPYRLTVLLSLTRNSLKHQTSCNRMLIVASSLKSILLKPQSSNIDIVAVDLKAYTVNPESLSSTTRATKTHEWVKHTLRPRDSVQLNAHLW